MQVEQDSAVPYLFVLWLNSSSARACIVYLRNIEIGARKYARDGHYGGGSL